MTKWKNEGQTLTEAITNRKRVISRTVFGANKVLIDSEVMQILLDKEAQKDAETDNQINKEMVKYYSLQYLFGKTLETNSDLHPITKKFLEKAQNLEELRHLMRYYYRESDNALPTLKEQIIERIIATKHRQIQNCTTYLISKGFEEAKVSNMDHFPCCNDLIKDVIEKYEQHQEEEAQKERERQATKERNQLEKERQKTRKEYVKQKELYHKLHEQYLKIVEKNGSVFDDKTLNLAGLRTVI